MRTRRVVAWTVNTLLLIVALPLIAALFASMGALALLGNVETCLDRWGRK